MSNPLFQTWQDTLTEVAENGRLLAAAKEALRLEATPDPLASLIRQWQAGDFSQLPEVELLSSEAISGAMGAYGNETIYLNEDWLSTASEEDAVAVLMEELGHHLDQVVNEENTPGDEGAIFASQVLGEELTERELTTLQKTNDIGYVTVEGEEIVVEQNNSSLEESFNGFQRIPAATPTPSYRTSGEWRNRYAFAALKEDGSVVTWGHDEDGGNSSGVADELSSGVAQIFSNYEAFAALKEDGSVVTWGDDEDGGDSSGVAEELSSGVAQIFSNYYAFAALKEDGSVVTWGSYSYGGNSSGVADELSSGVAQIFSTVGAFAALKEDGSVVTWGDDGWGGDSSEVANELSSGFVTIASPFVERVTDPEVISKDPVVIDIDTVAVGDTLFTVETNPGESEEDDLEFSIADDDDLPVSIDPSSGEVTLEEPVAGGDSFDFEIIVEDPESGITSEPEQFSVEFTIDDPPEVNYDITGNGEIQSAFDGALLFRYALGFTGEDLTQGIPLSNLEEAERTEASDIESHLEELEQAGALDITGNGEIQSAFDGALLFRYALGFTGEDLTQGIPLSNLEGAERTEASDIESFLNDFSVV